MESFSRMLNAQMVLLVYLAVGMYCMKAGLIDRETKKKLVDIILKITLPCMIFNSFNKPLTPEVLIQTALILVVAVAISILSFLLGKVIRRLRNATSRMNTAFFCYEKQITPHWIWYNRVD